MSLNIEAKKATVEGIAAGIASAQTMVIAEYRGISVANLTELRANARKEGVYLHVLKNTLVRRAVEGTSFAEADLRENFNALLDALVKAKPAAAKGQYVRKIAVSSTMGLGVRVDTASTN